MLNARGNGQQLTETVQKVSMGTRSQRVTGSSKVFNRSPTRKAGFIAVE